MLSECASLSRPYAELTGDGTTTTSFAGLCREKDGRNRMMKRGVMRQDDKTASHDETFLGWENHGYDQQGA
jgi:hypothetical protein